MLCATAQPPAPPPPVREGAVCVQHPWVQAAYQCLKCGAFMCPTCDFAFPGEKHFCPVCVSKPEEALAGSRKKLQVWSFVLAGWSTLGMTCVVSGALSGLAEDKASETLLGSIFLLFILAPAITGLVLGLSAKRKQVANPAVLWIAIVWNAILVATFVLLMVIGMTKT
jgi:hypothetical protein